MTRHSKILFVLAISASLALAGCVDALDEQLGSSSLDSEDNVAILVTVENAPDTFSHLGFAMDQVFLHEADTPQPDGFFELNAMSQADLIVAGTGNTLTIANGSVPAGTYDQVLFKLEAVQNHPGTGEEPHEHEDGADDHEHDHSSEDTAQVGGTTGPQDLAVNLTAAIEADEVTEIELVLDGTASTADGTFQPVLTKLVLRQDGEVTSESSDVQAQLIGGGSSAGPTTSPSTAPPVARMTVFAPSGDKAHEPAFQAEDGDFVNSLSSAYLTGEDIRFNAIESETVAPGATLESFEWDFGDGTTATGTNTAHAYTSPGVFEATLTVTDSNDVSDSHTLRVVIFPAGWTDIALEQSFEEEAEGWSTTAAHELTTWQLSGPGYESESAYYVGYPLPVHEAPDPVVDNVGAYAPLADATLTSPEITIPEDWRVAGFELFIQGGSEAGFDELTVSYNDGDGVTEVGTFSGSVANWTAQGSTNALEDAIGKTVTFTFTFSSDEAIQAGPGWFVDAFTIGGVPSDEFQNLELLESGGGHDGHDHEH